jgi:hypothetical protein
VLFPAPFSPTTPTTRPGATFQLGTLSSKCPRLNDNSWMSNSELVMTASPPTGCASLVNMSMTIYT